MSRPIKFRAWDCTRIIDLKVLSIEKPLPFPLMQFTGLHDKNGKEIWEGDILQDQYEELFTVQYHPAAFTLNQGETGIALYSGNITKGNMKIVGNIYENPELLK